MVTCVTVIMRATLGSRSSRKTGYTTEWQVKANARRLKARKMSTCIRHAVG
jgi:hypothetical protein